VKNKKPMTQKEYVAMMEENDGGADCPFCRSSSVDFVDGEWTCLDCKKTWYTQLKYTGYVEGE